MYKFLNDFHYIPFFSVSLQSVQRQKILICWKIRKIKSRGVVIVSYNVYVKNPELSYLSLRCHYDCVELSCDYIFRWINHDKLYVLVGELWYWGIVLYL